MLGESTEADIDVLQSRADVVDAVRAEPRRKSEIQAEIDVSRSTVNRAVRDLETAGLLTRTDEGYAVTAYGDLLADRYEAFLRDADDVGAAAPLLESLPSDVPLSLALLRDAAVHRSVAPAPHRPVSQFEDLLREADRLRGVSRTITQSTTPELIHRQVVDNGMEGEMVVGPELAAYMRRERREPVREMLETGRHSVYEAEDVPYGLALLDVDGETHVVAFVYNDNDDLLGTIVNDADAAVDWAEAQFERYRDAATDVGASFLEDEGA